MSLRHILLIPPPTNRFLDSTLIIVNYHTTTNVKIVFSVVIIDELGLTKNIFNKI